MSGANDKPTDFLSSFPEGTRDFVANKGWKDPVAMLTSYQQLESTMGADRVILPKEGDEASEKAFRAKLGVPEAPDKYEIKLPDGSPVDEAFLTNAKAWMHKSGLTPKQANALANDWAAYVAEGQKAADQAKLQASESGLAEVKKEWGQKYDENAALTQKAFKAIQKPAGLENADLDKIEEAIGTAKMMKMFAAMGGMVSEARFVDGGTASRGFTPEAARARMEQLKNDRDWFGRFVKNDAQAVAEWSALQEAAAAGLAA